MKLADRVFAQATMLLPWSQQVLWEQLRTPGEPAADSPKQKGLNRSPTDSPELPSSTHTLQRRMALLKACARV